jgi:hypothetical protein
MTLHGGTGGRGGSWPPLTRDGLFMIHRAIHNMWITVWETRQRQRVERTTPMTITPKPISRFQLLRLLITGAVAPTLARM